jgi:hypothetical protein
VSVTDLDKDPSMFATAFETLRPLPILAAAALSFILGGVYYGLLTPKPYARVMGRAALPPEAPGLLTILGPFLCNLVMIVTTALLLGLVPVAGFAEAMQLGLLIGVGYLLAMCMTIAINPNFPHPFLYTALNAPYFLVNILATTAILYALG